MSGFTRLTGPKGEVGRIGLAGIRTWATWADLATEPDQLQWLSRVDQDGNLGRPTAGDWIVDGHPSLWKVTGPGAITKIADLPQGPKGPQGVPGNPPAPHVHRLLPVGNTYAQLASGYATPMTVDPHPIEANPFAPGGP